MEKYYESGQLESKANYKDGKLHGLREHFKEDGSLKSSTTYQNGAVVLD
jgi:antitoxin component YwqK of YwqJK toxin-antitoxin module